VRSSLLLAALLGLASTTSFGCATAAGNGYDAPAKPVHVEREEALTMSVDKVDSVGGGVRIHGSMDGGGPLLSAWLGESCGTREVGRGVATAIGFTWTLSSEELAQAIQCNLEFLVHDVPSDDGSGERVRKRAKVTVDASVQDDEIADDGPSMGAMTTNGATTTTLLTFNDARPSMRLSFGDASFNAEEPEPEVAAEAPPPPTFGRRRRRPPPQASFIVTNDALAFAVVSHATIRLGGSRFVATLTIGSVQMDAEPEGEGCEGDESDVEDD
jgi:hypothetical protein